MYVLASHITIGEQLKLDFVTEVVINSSWQTFTDTAEITIPRKVWVTDKNSSGGVKKGIRQYIKPGDKVVIELGYGDEKHVEFEGYVAGIKPDAPLVITCEDCMYHLKRVSVTKSWKTVKLKELVGYLVDEYNKARDPGIRPEIKFEASAETEVGGFVAEKKTIAQVLESLKEFGISSFFRGNTLHVGYQSEFAKGKRYRFDFQENIVSDDLEYRMTEDVKVKIQAISNMPNGQKKTVEAGDPDGEIQSLNFYNISESDLKKKADEALKNIKRDGYKGSFTTFGLQPVRHGDTVELVDNEYTERSNQVYEVDTVKTSFGMGGFRRTLTPGYRLKS